MAASPESLHAAAVELVNRGRLAAARRLLDAAAERAEDVNLRARIMGTLALIQARSGALAEAEAMCTDAMNLPGLNRRTAAILTGQMASIAEHIGHLDDADRWYSKALVIVDDPIPRANLLINRSIVGIQRGKLDAALEDAALAAEVYAANDRPIDAAEARHNKGYIDLLRGDLVSALQEMLAARATLADVSPVSEAIGDVDRAEVLRDAGLPTEAESLLGHAASVFGRRMPRNRAEAEFSLARSLLTHDPPRSARVAASAARRFRALGNDTWALRADAVRLRGLLAAGAPLPSGERVPEPRRTPGFEEIESVATQLVERGFRGEAATLRMSHELWLARRGRSTSRRITRVPVTASMDARLLAHEVRAARATSAGRDTTVLRHAAAGLDDLGRWQRAFGSLDLQTSLVMHGRGLMYQGLLAARRSGRPDVLFEWSERARHLSQQVVPLRPPPDPALAAELSELRQLRSDDPAGDWLASPRAAQLRESARERQWSGTGSAEIQERITLEHVRGVLDSDTALISYVYSGSALTALVITVDRARIIPLDGWSAAQRGLAGIRADLDMSAAVRSGPMADVVRRSLEDRLAVLSKALLDEPAAAAGTRRLVITVPGVLNAVPWAMLPGMAGRTFTLAVSATRWWSLRATAGDAPKSAGFAVGPRVVRGEEEIRAAASAWSASHTLRGADATVDAVADLASGVDLLHVAAHGRHAVDNPLFSGLELADGALFGYDIDRMANVPSTVVLSACEVGRSSVRWGEEAIGMTRIWLHAGTRVVVAAPVIVADDVACELLGAMHAELAAGLTAAEALAAASARTGIVAPFQAHGAGF